jgi:transcriptional regulator of NAD metabolism
MLNLELSDVENFLKYIRRRGIKLIYSLDDNLLVKFIQWHKAETNL